MDLMVKCIIYSNKKFVLIDHFDIYIYHIIHKSSNNTLLLFGSQSLSDYGSSVIDKMMEHSLSSDKYESITKYELITKDSTSLRIHMLDAPEILMTMDEEFVFLFG